MLVREQNAIESVVYSAYERVRGEVVRELVAEAEKITKAFAKDPEVIALAAAMTAAGVNDPLETAFGILKGEFMTGYYRAGITTDGKFKERIDAAVKALPDQPVPFHASETRSYLSIALAGSGARWDKIQSHTYLLIADLQSAKTIAEVDKATRTFCAALA